MKLENKTVLVTGASRGIGRAIALAAANEGARVVVNYRIGREQASEVVHLIARRLVDHSALLGRLSTRSRDFH